MTSKRTFASFPINDFQLIKTQMLSWASRFNICSFLDSHDYPQPLHRTECLLAAGAADTIEASAGNALQQLGQFCHTHDDWLFGHFGYGLTRETEPIAVRPATVLAATPPTTESPDLTLSAGLTSLQPGSIPEKPDPIGFPDLFFFVPETVIELEKSVIHIGCLRGDPAIIFREICTTDASGTVPPSNSTRLSDTPAPVDTPAPADTPQPSDTPRPKGPALPPPPNLQPRLTREEYLARVRTLQEHIRRGDCYEINFCQEFYAENVHLDVLHTWRSLGTASPNPFSVFYRLNDQYLLCASPERFVQRQGNMLYSQPIKGTSPRIPEDALADKAALDELYLSPKDRAENVMVVDLVRNDLSRVCITGTVQVDELYGIYSFPQVHQMISTIRGELAPETGLSEVIAATFPMGSMTGAPKHRVVELIRRYETVPRGLFSGAVGYMRPSGDFDFNVVIRSLFYNASSGYLSCQVGSGITFYSIPESEYEECLIKLAGIRKALAASSIPNSILNSISSNIPGSNPNSNPSTNTNSNPNPNSIP